MKARLPSCSRAMRVESFIASCTSCVTKTEVLPNSARRRRNSRCRSRRVTGSRAPKGSSNKQDFRVRRECPGDADALPLSAGEFARKALREVVEAEVYRTEQRCHPGDNFVFGPVFQTRDQPDIALDGEVREQAAFLDDIADAAAKADAIPFGGGLAVHSNFARGGQMHPVDETQRGGFAGAAAAQQDQRLARLDGKRQAVQDVSVADAEVNVAKFDSAHRDAAAAFRKSDSAKPHSPSTHCLTHDQPPRCAMREISSERNLCEDSVQMVSPQKNGIARSSAPI